MITKEEKKHRLTENQEWFLNEIQEAGSIGMQYFLNNRNKYQSIPSRTLNKLLEMDLVTAEQLQTDTDGIKWYLVKIK
jgi:hypothetical protein